VVVLVLPSKRVKRLVLALLVAGAAGCASVSNIATQGFSMNGGKVEAGRDEVLYYSIQVNFDSVTDPAVLSARVLLSPDLPPVALRDLTLEFVSRHLSKYVPPPQQPELYRRQAEGWLAFEGDGLFIRFHDDGRPMTLGLCSHCRNSRQFPVVATSDGRLFPLPLSLAEAEQVFGPLPRAKRFSQVYY
jgi:hypothetical protein